MAWPTVFQHVLAHHVLAHHVLAHHVLAHHVLAHHVLAKSRGYGVPPGEEGGLSCALEVLARARHARSLPALRLRSRRRLATASPPASPRRYLRPRPSSG